MTEALDGMMGMIPMVMAGGIVMHMTDRMMGPKSRFGKMEGEQERYYQEEKPMYRGRLKKSGRPTKMRRKLTGTSPSGLSSMMKEEGRAVKGSIAYEGHKFGKGTLGSLPGVGKVTIGKVSDIGIGGNAMYHHAKKDMKIKNLGAKSRFMPY